MRKARSCNFSSLLLFLSSTKEPSHRAARKIWLNRTFVDWQSSVNLQVYWKPLERINSSGSTIAYIINTWFKVRSVIWRDTKDYDFVCRTQVVGLNQEWNGHPVVSGQNYILNVFMVGDHVVLMEPCNQSVTITHKVISYIFNTYIFVVNVIIVCIVAIFPDVWKNKKSFIKMLNNSGLRIVHWGTPRFMVDQLFFFTNFWKPLESNHIAPKQ